jgi:hypothetical protein
MSSFVQEQPENMYSPSRTTTWLPLGALSLEAFSTFPMQPMPVNDFFICLVLREIMRDNEWGEINCDFLGNSPAFRSQKLLASDMVHNP